MQQQETQTQKSTNAYDLAWERNLLLGNNPKRAH